MNDGMYSSNTDEWSTPQGFYDQWDAIYSFTLDAAATPDNAKAPRYYTKDDDGLTQPWEGTVWCNPPYGRGIDKWIQKGYVAARNGATVVMLIPARTDTRWWHDYVAKAYQIFLIKGRLKFGGHKDSAPFPSAVVVFRTGEHRPGFHHYQQEAVK